MVLKHSAVHDPNLLFSPLVPRFVLVREASPGDLSSLQRIARASFDPVYAFFALRGLRRSSFLLAAEDDGRLRGFLEGRLFPGAPSIGYVYFVATDPSARRRGVGRALVEEALRRWLHDHARQEVERKTEQYYRSLSKDERKEDQQWSRIAARSARRLWDK